MQDSIPSSRTLRFRPRAYTAPSQAALWRSIHYFNLYRLILAGLLVFLYGFGAFDNTLFFANRNGGLFIGTSIVYVIFAAALQVAIRLRRPRFALQLAMQVGLDIVCVTLLMNASGGVQNGLGILLLMSLAGTGLISRGRITLFFAALASIAVLLEHAYAVLNLEADVTQFVQAGLMSIAYFAVAWMAHTLARYAVASEELATRRGAELASMAEANRLVIQGMLDGVLVVDDRGVIRQYNPSAERLLGYHFLPGNETSLADCAPELADMFAEWRREPPRIPRKIMLPATGHTVRARFLSVEHENFWGALVFLEDMQRIQAQAQQIKLAALGRLTASIAHEIRNPLSAISYATELFCEEGHSSEQERLAKVILDNTSRIDGIVRDVMELNRRDRAQPEQLRLAEALPKFGEEICQAKHVPQELLQLDVKPECTVTFDHGHFYQILWNLCSNALRYCRKQPGSVRLRAWSVRGGGAMLEVADDGQGVAPEKVQQLFEPFFTSETSGTGLGLYIARELCEANGAELEYVQQIHGGACFRITFGGISEHGSAA